MSGLNQKISSTTESVIEVLDKLRQETTTSTTTTTTVITTTAAPTTVATTTVSAETTTLATTTTTIAIESETNTESFRETEETAQDTSDQKKTSLQREDGKESNSKSEKENHLKISDPLVEEIGQDEAASSTDISITENEDDKTTTTAITTTTTSNPLEEDSKFSGVDDSILNESDLVNIDMKIDDTQTEKNENKTDQISPEHKFTDRIEPIDDLTDVEPIDSFADLEQPVTMLPTPTVPRTPDLKSLLTSVSDDHQSQELNVTNDDKGDELTLSSVSRACSNVSEEGWSCNEEGSVDVVMIASVTVAIIVIIVIVSVVLSVWLCKKSHHRKNVYATMEEEQPKDFTKAGPPVILQDELSESINKPRLYLRNSDKVTEL